MKSLLALIVSIGCIIVLLMSNYRLYHNTRAISISIKRINELEIGVKGFMDRYKITTNRLIDIDAKTIEAIKDLYQRIYSIEKFVFKNRDIND